MKKAKARILLSVSQKEKLKPAKSFVIENLPNLNRINLALMMNRHFYRRMETLSQIDDAGRDEQNFQSPKASAVGAESQRSIQVPDSMLDTLIDVVAAHPLADNLSDDILRGICIEAIDEGTLDDQEWLEAKLIEVRASLDTTDPSSEEKISFEEELSRIVVPDQLSITSEEDLREVIRLHEIWMNAVLNSEQDEKGARANFEGLDLSGFNFSNANLSCANFKHATLVGSIFKNTVLSRATFDGATIHGATFEGAQLKSCSFIDADIQEIDLDGALIKKANFAGTSLENKILKAQQTSTASKEELDPFSMI